MSLIQSRRGFIGSAAAAGVAAVFGGNSGAQEQPQGAAANGAPLGTLGAGQRDVVTVDGVDLHLIPADMDSPYVRPPADPNKPVVGQGFFSAQHLRDLPVPRDMTPEVLQAAHGTVMVDPATGDIYWGVKNYGLICYRASEGYSQANKVAIPNLPQSFNMHGGELFVRQGRLMVVAADDEGRKVYFGAAAGGPVVIIGKPEDFEGAWKPTDVTVVQPDLNAAEGGTGQQLLVTNGYGNPPRVYLYDLGQGKFTSHLDVDAQTPHGVTASGNNTARLAQRSAGEIKSLAVQAVLDSLNVEAGWSLRQAAAKYTLPAGMRPCDVDELTIGDKTFLVVPLLRSAGNATGKVAIVHEGRVVSIIDTGDQHIHDATMIALSDGQLGFVSTSWNPGTAPKLFGFVQPTEASAANK